MGIQVDFLAAGDGSRCADAIGICYGNLAGKRREQTAIIIDGGTFESGDALVDHLVPHYGTSEVDFAILTHLDGDHNAAREGWMPIEPFPFFAEIENDE